MELRKKPTILLVDDDEDLLMLMRWSLKSEGFNVVISPNAENITTMIAEQVPDIIFLDIHMRGIDGGTICKRLKSQPVTSEIPVVMFSGNDDIASIASECGANEFLPKPFDSQVMASTVVRILKNQQH